MAVFTGFSFSPSFNWIAVSLLDAALTGLALRLAKDHPITLAISLPFTSPHNIQTFRVSQPTRMLIRVGVSSHMKIDAYAADWIGASSWSLSDRNMIDEEVALNVIVASAFKIT